MDTNQDSSLASGAPTSESNGLSVAKRNAVTSSSPNNNHPEQATENYGHSHGEPHSEQSADVAAADGHDAALRQGTISSARFNILCTMVGGGCLSLPMGFQKSGNALLGPILLVITAMITEFCFRVIISSARKLSPVRANTAVIGKDSFETLANAAFGIRGFLFAKWLVTAMCFFGAVGYAVLLRDMLQPITDAIVHHYEKNHNSTLFEEYYEAELEEGDEDNGGPTFSSNLSMLTVILLITPACTLRNLSSLEQLGALSMSSILILGGCIVYRSFQCNFYHPHEHFDGHVWPAFQLWPDSLKDVLDAFPLYVSCYVCHYNIPAVHNELQNPTPKRVNWWLRSTTFSASLFYLVIGVAGSAYGHCTPTGKVQGNVLLDFAEDDPLLLVARMCLACTLTLAFPLLVIPARDILLRSWFASSWTTTTISVTSTTHHSAHHSSPTNTTTTTNTTVLDSTEDSLREPLLAQGNEGEVVEEEQQPTNNDVEGGSDTVTTRATATAAARSVISQPQQHSFAIRLGTAILVLWSAAALASSVKSIDVVWDLLGSSLSILLSYLIPCGCFIVIVGKLNDSEDIEQDEEDNEEEDEEVSGIDAADSGSSQWKRKLSLFIAWGLVAAYVPLMVISTVNAFYDTFFK